MGNSLSLGEKWLLDRWFEEMVMVLHERTHLAQAPSEGPETCPCGIVSRRELALIVDLRGGGFSGLVTEYSHCDMIWSFYSSPATVTSPFHWQIFYPRTRPKSTSPMRFCRRLSRLLRSI